LNDIRGFFDTNILIDFLDGVPEAQDAIQPYSRRCISRITGMEVLVDVKNSQEEGIVRAFLGQFEIHEITPEIADPQSRFAVTIHRNSNCRMPSSSPQPVRSAAD
jgi:predicted nucleic acid-binding protein